MFDHPVIARCQLHKIRNVTEICRNGFGQHGRPKMSAAYHADSALDAQAALEDLAQNSTVPTRGRRLAARRARRDAHRHAPGRAPTLARTLRSTNPIESMISICRDHSANVKRWRDGQMALRWCAAGMVEAAKQFRRVNGFLHLPALRAALERESAESVGTMGHDDQVNAA